VLAQSEHEFRQTVRELESDALFRELAARGHIRKAKLAGWIPADRYADYLDSEMVPLIVAYDLDEHTGWLEEFARAEPQSAEELARRYRLPLGDAHRIMRYARHLVGEGDENEPRLTLAPGSADGRAAAVPPGDAEEWLAAFVARHCLSIEQLRTHVLDDGCSASESAAALGIAESEVARARDAALSVIVADAMGQSESAGGAAQGAVARDPSTAEPHVVASIESGTTGVPRIAFAADDEYALTYRLGPDGYRALYALARTRDEGDAFLRRIQSVGTRKAAVAAVVCAVFRAQSRFFVSGDPSDLAPLTQADLARRAKVAPSTVSRAIRGKGIEFRDRRYALHDLLVSRAQAIARVLDELPEVPDRVVAEVLSRRWGLRLSRRALAYHRLKLRGRKE
jgi:hypothetical protein